MEMPKVDSDNIACIIVAVLAFFAAKKLVPIIKDKAKTLALPAGTAE